MSEAGAVILVFGVILTFGNFRRTQSLRVGNVSGAAGPVMIVVGAILFFVGLQ